MAKKLVQGIQGTNDAAERGAKNMP